jgi:hypothetical protein
MMWQKYEEEKAWMKMWKGDEWQKVKSEMCEYMFLLVKNF